MGNKSNNILYVIRFLSLALFALSANAVEAQKAFHPHDYLGTKTPYPVPEDVNLNLDQCEVIHINHIGRHGSRHMNKTKKIDDLAAIVAEASKQRGFKGPLAPKLLRLLTRAKAVEKAEVLGQLTKQGADEHRGIGKRMYNKFPDLFSKSPASKALMMQSTHKQRTQDSLKAFLSGLAESDQSLTKRAQISASEKGMCDPSLRFFDSCNSYQKYFSEDRPWKEDLEKAVWQPEAKHEVKNVLLRFFTPSFIDTLDDKEQIDIVSSILALCQLDFNINKDLASNGFCSFFTTAAEMQSFNWEEDASNYFGKGYAGQEGNIAHRIACPLVEDFIQTTDVAITDPSNAPIANLRFGHAETVMPFVVQLGLYREDSKATMLNEPSRRKFRSGYVSPMAANVQWILYKCPQEEYRVRMLLNERVTPFPIPGCDKNPWCTWNKVKNFLNEKGRACNKDTWEKDVCRGVSCKISN
jgi:hypothetical protein